MVTNNRKDDHPFPKDGHQPSPGIQTLVTRQPMESWPPSSGWSPTVPKDKVVHNPQDGHPPTVEWSPIIMVFAFPSARWSAKQDLESNSSTAQLVNLVVSLAQHVSPSVALLAKLVNNFFFTYS